MPDCERREVEGWVDFMIALGFSGMWTGARREF